MSTIVLAEDHPLVREGIRAHLKKTTNHEVVAECGDGKTALELVELHRPDVLIADLRMPGLDGLELTRRVVKRFPRTAVVVLSMFASDSFVSTAFTNGARAYVLKNADVRELNQAISSALRGETFVSSSLARRGGREPLPSDRYERLSSREREVVQLIGEGFKDSEISDALHISIRTIEKHKANIISKLDLKNHADIVRYALQRGLVPLDIDINRKAS